MQNFIERRKENGRFHYFNRGHRIKNRNSVAYYKSLKIPPAWQDVRINVRRQARVLATGVDKAGRLQYIYNPIFRRKQDRQKFERILRFAEALPKMRRVTAEHLREPGLNKQKVMALVVRLIDEAYFRVGNEQYAKENQSYGITTLRSKHVTISGDQVTFDYTGKSGQHQLKIVNDRRAANVLKRLDELPGYEIFKYVDDSGKINKVRSNDVNQYIKDVMGEEFSAKDFRTWGGTLIASAELASLVRGETERERKKAVTACVKKVAQKLGNTPAITRSSYIDPRVIKAFIDSDDLATIYSKAQAISHSGHLRKDERCVLELLRKAA